MKWFLIILLVFTSTTQAIEPDKVEHFSVSYALSSVGLYALPKNLKWLSPVVTLAIGAAKELTDKRFDGADMAANGAGIGSSVLVFQLD